MTGGRQGENCTIQGYMHRASTICGLLVAILLTAGCVGSPLHSTVKYNNVQGTVKRNNAAMLSLKVGLSKHDVQARLGLPERSEGYQWGAAWLYRTAMTSGVYGTADQDFTPVVFDATDNLIGWGRNFFTETERKYRVEIHNHFRN